MVPDPENVPSDDTPDADTLFKVQKWGWDGIDRHDVIAPNQNEPYFKNGWTPQRLSYIDILLHCLPFKSLWYQPQRMFLRLTLLMLTHCLRYRNGGGVALIAML